MNQTNKSLLSIPGWTVLKNRVISLKYLNLLFFLSLVCAAFVLNHLSYYSEQLGVQFSLRTIPFIIVGVYFGPILGFINGVFIDLTNFLVAGQGPYSFLHTIQMGLYGLIPGIIVLMVDLNRVHDKSYIKSFARNMVIITTVVNSFILGSLFMCIYSGSFNFSFSNIASLLLVRMLKEAIKMPITIIAVYGVLIYMSKKNNNCRIFSCNL